MHTKDGLRISTVNTEVVAASKWSRPADRVIVLALATGVPSEDPDGTWGEALHLN
jgi:hypothetical protein